MVCLRAVHVAGVNSAELRNTVRAGSDGVITGASICIFNSLRAGHGSRRVARMGRRGLFVPVRFSNRRELAPEPPLRPPYVHSIQVHRAR